MRRLAEQIQEAIGAETDTVWLSADTMEKQLLRHPEMTAEEYQLLPTLIAQPDAVLASGENRVLMLALLERVYAVVIKATADRQENYLLSFYRADPKSVRRVQRNLKLLLGSFDRLMSRQNRKTGAPEGPVS